MTGLQLFGLFDEGQTYILVTCISQAVTMRCIAEDVKKNLACRLSNFLSFTTNLLI